MVQSDGGFFCFATSYLLDPTKEQCFSNLTKSFFNYYFMFIIIVFRSIMIMKGSQGAEIFKISSAFLSAGFCCELVVAIVVVFSTV